MFCLIIYTFLFLLTVAPADIEQDVCGNMTSITFKFKVRTALCCAIIIMQLFNFNSDVHLQALSCASNDTFTYTVILCNKQTNHMECETMDGFVCVTTSNNCSNITIIADNGFGTVNRTVNSSSAGLLLVFNCLIWNILALH